uniref:ATP synthase c subunit lysine N-methyltransferase n=1 Tax=Leptobrachium leishanense TaxID=445787 RepID=A0A8C5PAF5_9ANUR
MSDSVHNVHTAEEKLSLVSNIGTSKKKRWGLVITGVIGGSLVALYAVTAPFVAPALRKICLPYVPATTNQVENVLKMIQSRSGPMVDIGSGDGRIVIAAAKQGFQAVGYELNPWLVWYSRYRAWREGVNHKATFYISDLWKIMSASGISRRKCQTALIPFVITVAVSPFPVKAGWSRGNITALRGESLWRQGFDPGKSTSPMPQLEKKLHMELDESARVIACRFPFPHWIPQHVSGEGVDTVWIYDLEAIKKSSGSRSNDQISSETIEKNL